MENPAPSAASPNLFIKALREKPSRGTPRKRSTAEDGTSAEPGSSPVVGAGTQSAVLALLHPVEGGIALYFTERPITLRHHGGQVSFPGGEKRPATKRWKRRHLRETEEELGFPTSGVDILGRMTPLFVAPSHNLVHPLWAGCRHVLRCAPTPPRWQRYWMSRSRFCWTPTHRARTSANQEQPIDVPCYLIDHTLSGEPRR